jgi:hypothetical protein
MSNDILTIDGAKTIEEQIRERLNAAKQDGIERGKSIMESKIVDLQDEIARLRKHLQERYLTNGFAERDLNLRFANKTIRIVTVNQGEVILRFTDDDQLYFLAKGLRWCVQPDGRWPEHPMAPGYCDDKEPDAT